MAGSDSASQDGVRPSPGITTNYPMVLAPSYVLKISEDNAQVTAKKLTEDANRIAKQQVKGVPGTAFGPSGLGRELAAQTHLAQQKLHGAVDLMAGALHGYSVAVVKAKNTILATDDSSKQNITAVQQSMTASTDQLGAPIAAAPPTPNTAGPAPTYTTPGTSTNPCAPPDPFTTQTPLLPNLDSGEGH